MSELTEFEDAETNERLQRSLITLQRQLKEAKAKQDLITQAAKDAATAAVLAQGPAKPIKGPTKDRRKSSEVALWHLSDWQGSKQTSSYNQQVCRDRVGLFVEKAVRITNIQRADHPVKEAFVCFGGDMIEGLFNFPTQPFEIDATLFEQWAWVARLCADVVLAALENYEHVTVVAEWGNHGRIGSKRDNVPRSDNIDRMVYWHAKALCGEQPRLTWEDSPEDIQRIEIGNYRALLIHGDEIGRNGYASPATITSWATRQKSGAYPWHFADVYVGHYHNHSESSMPDGHGTVYFTGSTESDNRYAGVTMAASAVPSQRLHFIDPEKGRVTCQYKVTLDG